MWKGTLQEYARKERVFHSVIETDIKRLKPTGETWLEYAAGGLFVFVQRFLLRRPSIYFLDLPFGIRSGDARNNKRRK